MLYEFASYIKFLFTSTNQHGIHSPFIYNYVTKCLYPKSNFKGGKSIQVLLKSIGYFRANAVHLGLQNHHIQNLIKSKYPNVELGTGPYDIIYVDHPKMELVNNLLNSSTVHNDTMLLIGTLYKNRKIASQWELIKRNDRVTVSVDMYHCGAVFFRKEQAKEHFKIRT
jgi:hypothetical protein